MPPEAEEKSPDKSSADIGIVCALSIELGAFFDRCEHVRKYSGGKFTFRGGFYDDIRVAAVESGMGYARARRATQALLDGHSPRWLLSCGFAGALEPQMQVGDIVIASTLLDTHGHEMQIDVGMQSDPARGLYVGRLMTADQMVRLIREKEELASAHSAIAVDMESLAVAQVARETKTRFMCVRVISDDMSADLPPEILSIFGSTGTVRAGAALGALWKRPSSAKDMLRLRDQAQRAAARLATFLDGIVTQLHAAGE